MTEPLLRVDNLHVRFKRDGTLIHPVRGVSLRVCTGAVSYTHLTLPTNREV